MRLTTVAYCGKTSTRPSSSSRISASRIGVELTPNCSASAARDNGEPGGNSSEMIMLAQPLEHLRRGLTVAIEPPGGTGGGRAGWREELIGWQVRECEAGRGMHRWTVHCEQVLSGKSAAESEGRLPQMH